MLFFTVAGNRGKMTKAGKGEIRTGGEGESARGRRRKLDAVKDLGVKRERREKKKKSFECSENQPDKRKQTERKQGKKNRCKKTPQNNLEKTWLVLKVVTSGGAGGCCSGARPV